jgi:hypothetical protein
MTDKDEKFSDQEATHRVEKALRAAFSTPHKTYEESKVRKRKPPADKSPGRRKSAKN